MVTVTTDEICEAIKLCYDDARVVLEPAGALGVAGTKKYAQRHGLVDQTLVAVTSGANMDFDSLRYVSERADESERTVAVTIPETPGSFRKLYELIWPRNVTEFSYRFESDVSATIFYSFRPTRRNVHDFDQVLQNLRDTDVVVWI